MLAPFSSEGIQKEQQEISFIKQNKRGEIHMRHFISTSSLRERLAKWTQNLLWGFMALSLLFKISLDLKGGEAEAGRSIAGSLKLITLSPRHLAELKRCLS